MKKPQPQMEWTVDGMDDVMATADDDPTADEVRAALHFDGRVMARLELSPREGPGPNGSKPKFGKKSRYHAPALICAHEGLLDIHERYQVQVPPGAMNGSALVKMDAKLARIAASGWTERTVH